MNITVFCPRCESRYQVDESLNGKRMRCPNPLCKTIFEVRAEGDQPAPEATESPAPAPLEKPPPTVTGFSAGTDLRHDVPSISADERRGS